MAYNRTLQHFTSSQELATIWASGQNYIVNQLVLDSDKLYRCNTAHTSGATFAGDSAYWTGLNQGGVIDIAGGGTGQTTATAAFGALAPTTTAGDLIVYNGTDNIRLPVGTDGQMIVADASQTNKLKWATVPQGSKNYITYSNFENNATTGWSLFNTTLTSKIPTGAITSGAASLNALSVTSSTPLAGSYSLSVSSPGAVTAGQGFITDVLTIDREDQAKVLTFSFYYETVSGTMDFSGTSSNTWAIYIHDGTNWIQPAGVYGMTQSSGAGLVTGTFQTNSTGTSYRLAVVCITATGAAISMKFDDFKLSPQTAPIGPVVTDWVSYTPTGSWTVNTTYSGKWRRVGDMMEGKIYISLTGAPNAAILTVNLPSGYTIDTTKYPAVANGYTLGNVYFEDFALTGYDGFSYYSSSTSVGVKAQDASAGFERSSTVNATTPFAWGNQDYLAFDFRVPISGWSSNVQTSDSTDTRVVAFLARNLGASSTSVPTGSAGTKVLNLTPEFDTHSGWSSVNSQYVIPVSGYYDITTSVYTGSFTGQVNLGIILNGSYSEIVSGTQATANPQTFIANRTYNLKAGDTVALGTFQTSGSTQTYAAFNPTGLKIQRLSGPSVIAATENVIAKYSTTAGQAITSIPATVVYATREIDSHGIVNTINGDITIPISGKYLIGVYGSTASTAWGNGQQFLWQIRKNGSFSSFINQIRAQTAYTGILESVGPTYINCLAGDIINIQAQSSTATNLRTAAGTNFFYLVRLGN